MKRRSAEKLLTVDINALTLEQLQKHKVKLIDAWRESTAFYGWKQALEDDYYCIIVDTITGFIPKNKYLTQNLLYWIDEVKKREIELLSEYE